MLINYYKNFCKTKKIEMKKGEKGENLRKTGKNRKKQEKIRRCRKRNTRLMHKCVVLKKKKERESEIKR